MVRVNQDKEAYKANLWKTYLFRFFRQFQFFTGVLVPFFTIWGGISFFQVMILQAIFTLSIFFLEIPTGVVADKFGRKTSLILSGLVGILAVFVYSSHPNFWVFALGEFLWAIGVSLVSGADQAMVYDSLRELKKEKTSKKVFAKLHTVALTAIMISAPIGSLIAKYFGLRITMVLVAIPFFLSAVVACTLKEPTIGRKVSVKRKYFKTLKKGMLYFKNHSVLKIMVVDYVVISALVFFLIWVYQVKLQSLQVDIGAFGFVHAAMVLAQIIILNTFIPLEKFFGGKNKYILFSALITGVAFIVVAFANNVYLAIAGILVASAFGLTRKPLFLNYMNKFIRSGERATVLSAVSMVYSFSMATVNLIAGYLVGLSLTYTLMGIGVLIIGFGLFSKLEEVHLID